MADTQTHDAGNTEDNATRPPSLVTIHKLNDVLRQMFQINREFKAIDGGVNTDEYFTQLTALLNQTVPTSAEELAYSQWTYFMYNRYPEEFEAFMRNTNQKYLVFYTSGYMITRLLNISREIYIESPLRFAGTGGRFNVRRKDVRAEDATKVVTKVMTKPTKLATTKSVTAKSATPKPSTVKSEPKVYAKRKPKATNVVVENWADSVVVSNSESQ
jgi:hypothetical protein